MESEKENYEADIDNIINEYKTQLEVIKTKTSCVQNSPNQNIQGASQPDSKISEPKIPSNSFSDELRDELKNDNIKLQSELTLSKSQINTLNSTITSQANEIKTLSERVALLENELKIKDKEYNEKINEIKNKLTEDNSSKLKQQNDQFEVQKQKLNEICSSNKNILYNYFDYLNKNSNLFIKAQIINNDLNFVYSENDHSVNEKNFQDSLSVLDSFVHKLMNDNTEMFNQLVNYKNMVESNENINSQNLKDLKLENMLLKQQLGTLSEKLAMNRIELENTEKKGANSNQKIIKKKALKKRSGSCMNIPKSNTNISTNFSTNHQINPINFQNKMEIEPIKRLKLKIKDLENKIRGDNLENKEDDEE